MKGSLVRSSIALLLLSPSQRSVAVPCTSSEVFVPSVVSDTAGALQLAEALNCSAGGSFDVEWVGSVVMEEPIRVFGGTSLSLTGTSDKTSILDGTGQSSLFEVHSGSALHLFRLGLTNGAGVQGAVIHATGSYVTMAGCTVSNNTGDCGAGIFLKTSTLETENSSFTGNMASKDGGALYMSASVVTVGRNVLFEGNNASSGGAAYLTDGSAFVIAGDTVSFARNTAAVHGGGVHAQHSTVSVSNTVEFVGNSAEFGGGARTYNCSIWIHGDVMFSNNSASGRGGALQGDFSIINFVGTAMFRNNSASISGGGITMWNTDMHVQDSGKIEFVGNTAGIGGAAYIGAGTLYIEGEALFRENVANLRGGAVNSDFSFINISGNTVWVTNRAPEVGGGLNMWESNMSVQASGSAAFVGNHAGHGGGVSVTGDVSEGGGTLSVVGKIGFIDNLSDNGGGGLFSGLCTILVSGVAYWEGNLAGKGGGALEMSKSTLLVQSQGTTKFVGNTAEYGGAVYSHASTILVDGNLTFAENSAVDRGGALFNNFAVVNISGTAVFENNTAPVKGGGCFSWSSGLHVEGGGNIVFSNNSATVGGGLTLGGYATMTVTGMSTFSNNTADVGAGIKMEQFSSGSFAGAVTMFGNSASSSGGAMHCESPTLLSIDGVKFVSNYAGVSGGAITTLLAGTEISAVGAGAKPAVIWNCEFTDNTAVDAGGAVFIAGGFVNIAGSQFRGNLAGESTTVLPLFEELGCGTINKSSLKGVGTGLRWWWLYYLAGACNA